MIPISTPYVRSSLHTLTAPDSLHLPALAPFENAAHRIEVNDWLAPDDRAFLTGKLAELQDKCARLEFVLPPGVIHGDASIGNVLRDYRGNPVLIDLDGFAIGPREWDVVLTAMYYDSFGWHTREEYETFVQVYGFDIMTWPKLASRSRGTVISTGPASVSTVFSRWPLRELPPLRPSGSFFP